MTKGKIKHHPDYVEEKINIMINRLKNINCIQKGECRGLKNEIFVDFECIKKYIDFFLESYEYEVDDE